jgi:hypothetical protein
MPNNMITKYGSGGKAPKKMNMGGMSYGAGDGDVTPRDANMNMMAKNGGLVGFPNGGSVLDGMMMGKGGSSTKAGEIRKTARRAYKN